MRYAAISRVYAAALMELAQEKGELGAVVADLDELTELLAAETDFTRALESPELGFDQKRRFLERVTEGARSSLTLRFLLLLVQKHRETMLEPILDMFRHLRDEQEGRMRGSLFSAQELGAARVAKIEESLGRATGRKVSLETETSEDLLAGMVLHMADKTIDGSLKSRLSQLREHLLTAEL